jgi:hypothetical protein
MLHAVVFVSASAVKISADIKLAYMLAFVDAVPTVRYAALDRTVVRLPT